MGNFIITGCYSSRARSESGGRSAAAAWERWGLR